MPDFAGKFVQNLKNCFSSQKVFVLRSYLDLIYGFWAFRVSFFQKKYDKNGNQTRDENEPTIGNILVDIEMKEFSRNFKSNQIN